MGVLKVVLIIFGIIVLAFALYFTFFFSYSCESKSCFQARQIKCGRTKYVNDFGEITWLYYIKGKQENQCDIEVSILQVKEGSIERKVLEGKSMNCFLPVGDITSPEKDISICHGILKEELQNLIIRKLHSYILDSIGEISEELQKTT